MNILLPIIHIITTILLCLLLFYSIYQRYSYTITDGILICSKSLDQCLLSFFYQNEKIDLILPYSTVGIDGTFKTEIGYQIKNDEMTNLIVIGSRNQVFYGTTFKICLYFILSFLSISLFFISKKITST